MALQQAFASAKPLQGKGSESKKSESKKKRKTAQKILSELGAEQ